MLIYFVSSNLMCCFVTNLSVGMNEKERMIMRFFEPDKTKEVSITLTAKDWLIVCECLSIVMTQADSEPELSRNIARMGMAISQEASK